MKSHRAHEYVAVYNLHSYILTAQAASRRNLTCFCTLHTQGECAIPTLNVNIRQVVRGISHDTTYQSKRQVESRQAKGHMPQTGLVTERVYTLMYLP